MQRAPAPLAALCLLASLTGAQVRSPGQPASDWATLGRELPTVVLPTPDIVALKLEDEERGHRPFRYGEVLETSHGLDDSGCWETAPEDGSFVWRLRLTSPGAYTLGVVFSEYALPSGCQVFLYDEHKRDVLGAYTELNNKPNGQLGVQPLGGDTVIVELVQQPWVTDTPRLRVGQVIHDYRDVNSPELLALGAATSGRSGSSCLVGVNCADGANYQDVKRSVVRTLAGGALCSAALLNNVNQDATPYLLCAEHCGSMTNGVFLFNYETAGCGISGGPVTQTVSGATSLASTTTYDSWLHRINATIPSSYNPFFAGWDRAFTSGSPVVTIGHGGGCPKQIATDANGAVRTATSWNAFWSSGLIVGGSSGGPLFNAAKRVIGPACCVDTFTCGLQTSSFGLFDSFWIVNSLWQWLDPGGTGATFLDGYDPYAFPPVLTLVAPNTTQAFGGAQITLTGTGFTGASGVSVAGIDLSTPLGYQIVSDTQITFNAPIPPALGPQPIVVTNFAGPSNVLNLIYVETDPPKIAAPATAFGGFNFTLTTAAGAADPYALLVAFNDPTTFPFLGDNLLLNSFFLSFGTLSSTGVVQDTVVPPIGVLVGVTVYSQAVTVDGGGAGYDGATNVSASTFLF